MAIMNNTYQRYPLMGSSSRVADSNTNTSKISYSNIGVSSSNAYKQYQQNSIYTASPQELTLMLYNGLVRFLKQAHESITENDSEKANNYIVKAQNIILEFASTLDMQYEVSNGLMAIYEYMNRRLIDAKLCKDNIIIDEITGYAEELRDTWAQALKLAKQQTTAAI